MKAIRLFPLFLMLLAKPLFAQTEPQLARQIDTLQAEEKKLRLIWQQADNMRMNKATRESVAKKVALTDSLDFPKLQKIFQRYGYPGYNIVGKKSSHNFWLLVDHQTKHPAFQDSVLAKMKTEVDNKNASAYDFAVLTDRIRLNAGQPQVYGTQIKVNKDSTSYEPKAVFEPEKLNERRKSMGLSTMEEYIQTMNSGVFDEPKKKK